MAQSNGEIGFEANADRHDVPRMTNTSIIGVDVGGTFTDLVAIEPMTGRVQLAKTPSTMDNQAFGVLNALDDVGVDLKSVELIVHGTTTTTNAVLERKLAKTGLITTQGFRDILELGRRTRPKPYGMTGSFTPIIPRDLRLEVPERMDAAGGVITPLDAKGVLDATAQLIAQGCEAVVIHFLHAYANPAHELAAFELIKPLWPNSFITMGHALLSESREFERGVTAAVNASVQPILERYIQRLRDELKGKGYLSDVLVMNGNGGMVSASNVSKEAAKTVMSGPASGVIAAAATGRAAGIPDLITYDMGGTSTDVALILNAEPAVSSEIEVDYALPIHVPMVDVRTVGAGGGSIASIDTGGLLQVGPKSAGALPGPICYGRGGSEPTISDANLVLGRLNPAKLKSVDAEIRLGDVEQIFEERIGKHLGLSASKAASAVVRIANTKMAGAIRMVSVSLGVDPRDLTLFAFGGAGPLHASALAKELGVPRVLVPARPGITNALGCVLADLRHDFVQTLNRSLTQIDQAELHGVIERQIADGDALLNRETVQIINRRYLFSVDMQFVGQSHILRVPLETQKPTIQNLQMAFDQVYFDRFKINLPNTPLNLVNVNTSVIGIRHPPNLAGLIDPKQQKTHLSEAQTGVRPVVFDDETFQTPIYWRDYLPANATIQGPAILEQMDTTILIEPGDRVKVDKLANIVIEVGR